MLAFADVEMST